MVKMHLRLSAEPLGYFTPILFLIAIDLVIKKTTDSKRGITWSIFTTLEDLDFADDIALLSSTHSDTCMQEKTKKLSHFASQLNATKQKK